MLSGLGSDPEFFTRWRSVCVESMTLIDVLPEGEGPTSTNVSAGDRGPVDGPFHLMC
jgi:hypothetical protein